MNWVDSTSELGWIPIAVVGVATLISGFTDLCKYRVYNALTFPLMLGGLLYHGVVGGWSGVVKRLGLVVRLCGIDRAPSAWIDGCR